MGIRNLNQYLRQNCPNSIKCLTIAELSGKKIAVDISIYLYKYEAENALLENMYSMLSIFIYYNIIPIFIFDGKAPPEKKALLKKRRECRELAQEEYDKLKTELELVEDENVEDEIIEKERIISSMEKLKKQMVQIDKTKIENVKALIRAYGATYFDAPGEADEVCALLVIKQKVWACLSEDMDLFVYGCSRVLRYFSLISHTVVLYHSKGIYKELKMTHKEFKEICVLSGTDYNSNNADVSLTQTLVHFKHFKEARNSETFYNWLICNTDYISYNDIDALNKVLSIFNIESNRSIDIFNDVKIASGPIRHDEIQQIMKEEDFIFCN